MKKDYLNQIVSKLNEGMHAVQNLQIQPTEHNVTMILKVIRAMREAGTIAAEMNKLIPVVTDAPEAAAADQAAAEPAAETDAGTDQAAADPDEFEDRER